MELSNINSAPHPPSHISSITRDSLFGVGHNPCGVFSVAGLIAVGRAFASTRYLRSQRTTWPGVPARTGLCPPALPAWGSGAVASGGCGEYLRHTQTDRHAERCSSIHSCKHRHSPHRHKQTHVIIQTQTLHSPQPHGCKVRSDYAVPCHVVGQWDEFYLSVDRTCDRFLTSICITNGGPYEEIYWNCTEAKNHHIQTMAHTGWSWSAVSVGSFEVQCLCRFIWSAVSVGLFEVQCL